MPFCISQVDPEKDTGENNRAGSEECYLPTLTCEDQALSISIHRMVQSFRLQRACFAEVSVALQNLRVKRCHMFNKHLVGTFHALLVGAQRPSQSDPMRIHCHPMWEAPDTLSENVVGQLAPKNVHINSP